MGIETDPVLTFSSSRTWTAWLAKHHAASSGLWLKLAKKESGIASVSYDEALEVALCYGWIDGQRRSLDVQYYLQRFSPRSARSKWSKINCARVTALMEKGEMKPAGLREIERAKADGRWDVAYDGPRTAEIPSDLAKALAKSKAARDFFQTLDSRNRYAVLHRIHDAKKPETRARRIATFVEMLRGGKKIYP